MRFILIGISMVLVSCGDSETPCAGSCQNLQEQQQQCESAYFQTPDADLSTITANPINVPANGTATSTITVTVRDGGNNVVPYARVNLNATGNNAFFSPPIGFSQAADSNGMATWTVADNLEETKVVSADIYYDPRCPCGASCVDGLNEITLKQTVSIEFGP